METTSEALGFLWSKVDAAIERGEYEAPEIRNEDFGIGYYEYGSVKAVDTQVAGVITRCEEFKITVNVIDHHVLMYVMDNDIMSLFNEEKIFKKFCDEDMGYSCEVDARLCVNSVAKYGFVLTLNCEWVQVEG